MEKLQPVQESPIKLWDATDVQKLLNYKGRKSFLSLIDEVVDILNTVDIPFYENVIAVAPTEPKEKYNFHLSRFACFLLVGIADKKKEGVARLQDIIFHDFEKYGITRNHFAAIDRFDVREELADANKLLTKRAARSNVKDYGSFYDAGYSGLYSMSSKELHTWRKVPNETSITDLMGNTELAANLLRVNLTAETIRVKNIRQQTSLEQVHFNVSNSIRILIHQHMGIYPEQLPLHTDLDDLKRELKDAYEKLNSK
tara:strand:+ start:3789 stop:4556 length:768 start_codon:yes stop_codon:yes gene_type:complete